MPVRAVAAAATAAVPALQVVPCRHHQQAVLHMVVYTLYGPPWPLVLWGGIGLFPRLVGGHKTRNGLLRNRFEAALAKTASFRSRHRQRWHSVAPALFYGRWLAVKVPSTVGAACLGRFSHTLHDRCYSLLISSNP